MVFEYRHDDHEVGAGSSGGAAAPGKQLDLPLAGWKASFPSLGAKDAGAVIILVTFSLHGRDEVRARLDIQKQMFIDKIPETLDARETAQAISGSVAITRG